MFTQTFDTSRPLHPVPRYSARFVDGSQDLGDYRTAEQERIDRERQVLRETRQDLEARLRVARQELRRVHEEIEAGHDYSRAGELRSRYTARYHAGPIRNDPNASVLKMIEEEYEHAKILEDSYRQQAIRDAARSVLSERFHLTDESWESREVIELLSRFERDDSMAIPEPIRRVKSKIEELEQELQELTAREDQLALQESWSNFKSSGIFAGSAIWFWVLLSCIILMFIASSCG